MCVFVDVCAGRYSTGVDRKFALLEDLFKKFPSMPVSVEIKENNSELIKKVKIKNFKSFPIKNLLQCQKTANN